MLLILDIFLIFLIDIDIFKIKTVPGNFLFDKSLRAGCRVKRAQPIVGSDGAPFKTMEAAPVDERQISI